MATKNGGEVRYRFEDECNMGGVMVKGTSEFTVYGQYSNVPPGELVIEDNGDKHFSSPDYNYSFRYKDGLFARWGKTVSDDPQVAPAPEILDIEVTTICGGVGKEGPCPFCYKSNTAKGSNMSFATFKTIIDKMPANLTQIAIGADAKCESNPDIWQMMEYCRSKKIVPNITVADISEDAAIMLAKYCGAVAVSRYANKEYCYDSIAKLTRLGMKQVNIHIMLSQETLANVIETVNDYGKDERLSKLNAIVLLSLKKKGRGKGFTPLTQEQFKSIVDLAFDKKVPIGFDSCSAHKFLKAVEGRVDYKKLEMLCEPCESTCFSSYCDVDGDFYPCSFCEGIEGWEKGVSIKDCESFTDGVWNNERVKAFRDKLLAKGRQCPVYEV